MTAPFPATVAAVALAVSEDVTVTITRNNVGVQVGHWLPESRRREVVDEVCAAIDERADWVREVVDHDRADGTFTGRGSVHRRATVHGVRWDVWCEVAVAVRGAA